MRFARRLLTRPSNYPSRTLDCGPCASSWKTPCDRRIRMISRDCTVKAKPMIKRIVVGIDTSEHSRVAQAYAFALARRLGATLIGLHVVDIVSIEGSFFHDISGSLGLEPYLDFSSKMREVLTARGRRGGGRVLRGGRARENRGRATDRHGSGGQSDLRAGQGRRSGDDRPSRRPRTLFDRTARLDCRERGAQEPAAAVRLAQASARNKTSGARLRRQRAGVEGDARRRRSLRPNSARRSQ